MDHMARFQNERVLVLWLRVSEFWGDDVKNYFETITLNTEPYY